MNYGIQLYSIRDLAVKELEKALEEVSKIGYKFVEFAGFFDHTSSAVKEMLQKYNLSVSGTHTRLAEISENFDAMVDFHKQIGCSDIIIPIHDLSDGQKLEEFINEVNKYSFMLAKEGITLHYHNHAREFYANEDGTLPYSLLERETKLLFEVDTYWAYVAKLNPIKLLERLGDRIKFIHIKDGDADGHGMPLGMGSAPVGEVKKFAQNAGLKIVVESETCNPDGRTECEICYKYLNK